MGRRNSRLDADRFVIEGPVLIDEAIGAGIPLDSIFTDERWVRESGWRQRAGSPVAVEGVVDGVLASILSTRSPQPVCAVAPLLDRPIDELIAGCVAAGRPLLVLDALGDPGNVGTLLRAAEASGCGGVVLTRGSADLYNPKTVRASAGSIFRVPVTVGVEIMTVVDLLADSSIATWAAVARGGVTHLAADLDGAVALIVANEAHGLPDAVADACTDRVTITMDGPTESLNVAMAGTVLAFEALRQRMVSGSTSRIGHNDGHESA